MRIADKVVVITGGASGLGLATARYLAAEKGAKVALFDLNDDAGNAAAAEMGDRGMYVQADVGSDVSFRRSLDKVMSRWGAIHVGINCAAILGPAKVLDRDGMATPLSDFARVTAVNLVGTFNVMSQCAERMASNKLEDGEERGVIVNVASIVAYEGQIGQCAYAAAKAGVIGLNLPAARELGARGIRVNSIAPGLFLTPMADQLTEKALEQLKSQAEAPRRMGDMREFAHCCVFLIENAYMNGETVRLDAATRLRAR